MNVNTAELKNGLSKFLRHIRRTGETITVCDRNRPIALLSPLPSEDRTARERERKTVLRRAERLGIRLTLPADEGPDDEPIVPEIARDGRRDTATIEWVRAGRDY
jgi:antitoxin (DNA-binding transcriptional repressor) of toxin-antitoxin stability system